jgi:hypothetical protein
MFRRIKHRIFIYRVKRIFDKPKLPHFFIISAGRSGSTLLRKHLQNHPHIHIPPESEDFIPKIVEQSLKSNHENSKIEIKNYLDSREWLTYWGLNIELLFNKSSSLKIVDNLYNQHRLDVKPNALLIGDKTPLLNNYLDVLNILYPSSKVIYVVRDFRAVVNSYIQSRSYTLDAAINRCKTSIYIYNKFKSRFGKNLITIQYEDFIYNTENNLKSICLLLGVEYDYTMLSERNENLGDTHLSHHANVRYPIQIDSIEKWKAELNQKQIDYITNKLRKELKQFNYIT